MEVREWEVREWGVREWEVREWEGREWEGGEGVGVGSGWEAGGEWLEGENSMGVQSEMEAWGVGGERWGGCVT